MERLIVFALVFLLPTQLAYHIWPDFSYIYGLRVDYLSVAFYLTDILILFLIPYFIKRLKKIKKTKKEFKKLFFISAFLTLFVVLNTMNANVFSVALIKWINIFKLIFLGTYFYLLDLEKLKTTISSALKYSLVVFTAIGLLQFIFQKTIGGPFYLFGERSFSLTTPGISLVSLLGNTYMRAYSTFPHPNSFAGFIPVIFLIYLFLNKNKDKNIFKNKEVFILFLSVILSQLITFSLNAFLGIIFILLTFYLLNKSTKQVDKNKGKILSSIKKHFSTVLILASVLFTLISPSLLSGLPPFGDFRQSLSERVVLAKKGLEVFSSKSLLGLGGNNFFEVSKSTQPIHNIYLIILVEFGLLGLVIVYCFLTKLLKQDINNYLLAAIVFVLITGLFDHYWLTIQQNQLIFSILLGLSLRKI